MCIRDYVCVLLIYEISYRGITWKEGGTHVSYVKREPKKRRRRKKLFFLLLRLPIACCHVSPSPCYYFSTYEVWERERVCIYEIWEGKCVCLCIYMVCVCMCVCVCMVCMCVQCVSLYIMSHPLFSISYYRYLFYTTLFHNFASTITLSDCVEDDWFGSN